MRYLSLGEVLEKHRRVVAATGGATAVRDLGGLQSAVVQPRMTFARRDVYPGLAAKAAALGFSLMQSHPFVDGNKRVGHAAMEILLVLNGRELDAPVDEAEKAILEVAAGTRTRDVLVEWVPQPMRPVSS